MLSPKKPEVSIYEGWSKSNVTTLIKVLLVDANYRNYIWSKLYLFQISPEKIKLKLFILFKLSNCIQTAIMVVAAPK